ncbi:MULTISPECIES: hypothetical protein [Pelosinus]|uniref:Terminase n=1 Tax=Pelosinus fermentans B4 TaxID=1149862 RepID=I8RMA5_9FIRM|nr:MULTISPECIES: hypothetical protein [Pelosinus]EIW19925.1 hypothetical protein FB4_0176 [Pelosinus fermentans B4]EIW21218.1 hypothetical protein FA11_0945 [Pelosinus fermentans A11]
MAPVPNTEFDYREDVDPISGAPVIISVPKTVQAALDGIPYAAINNIAELFQPDRLREAWRLLRRNDPFDYQLEIADAIIYSCINSLGWLFVVMISRQAGKNEISAFIEHYLLLYGYVCGIPVSGVKFAPVHKPQVQASKDRLEGANTPDGNGLAGCTLTKNLWKAADGYKYHVGPPRDSNKWAFLSINPSANIASQTAFTLLEGDEAQDIDTNKWEKDAQPMATFRNATTVFYGVTWTKNCHIEKAKSQAYDMETRLEAELGYRPKLVFKVDAPAVIRSGNAFYKKAFESQLARLGPDHIAIQTQYLLNAVDTIGKYFTKEHVARMYANDYRMRLGPDPKSVYIFSVDVAGQEEGITEIEDVEVGCHKRDGIALHIGELQLDGTVVPVCMYQWVGIPHSKQREQILAIIKHWRCIGGAADATGIGEALAYYLVEKLPNLEIEPYKFKAAGDENKSKLGYLAYNYVTADKIKIPPKPQNDPQQAELWEELKWQIENLVRVAKKQQSINFHVPQNTAPRKIGHEAHDDLVMALFLLIRAAFIIKNPNMRKAKAIDRNDVM